MVWRPESGGNHNRSDDWRISAGRAYAIFCLDRLNPQPIAACHEGRLAPRIVPGLRTSDDSNGDRPRNGTAWPDPGGAPNHDDQPLDGLALYANYLCASRLGANRLCDCASDRHASIGRHGQATALAACRPYWPRSAKGCRRPGQEPERLRLQLGKQGLRSSSVLLMPSQLPRTRTGRRAPSVGHGIS